MRLEAPLMAFGGETIDNYGVIRDFPALSMVTGLLANALGYRREESELHDRLQARLLVGARLDREIQRLTDFQTAQLSKDDKGWTTWGMAEERRGGAESYKSPHLRYRDYHASLNVLVALRLEPAAESPTLDDLAQALDHPARPLFIGRKSCLPSRRVFAGWHEAENVLAALQTAQLPDKARHLRDAVAGWRGHPCRRSPSGSVRRAQLEERRPWRLAASARRPLRFAGIADMSFQLLRLQPDPTALAPWATRHRLLSPDGDYGYALHALLSAAFGDLAPKPFHYLGGRQGLLAYTSADLEMLRLNASLAPPDVARALGLDHLDARPFPNAWRAGQRLGFEARVRPVVRGKDGRERDAYLHAVEGTVDTGQIAGNGSIAQRTVIYSDWLEKQFGLRWRSADCRSPPRLLPAHSCPA
jgi:CRISPR system Cascade subunit CasD